MPNSMNIAIVALLLAVTLGCEAAGETDAETGATSDWAGAETGQTAEDTSRARIYDFEMTGIGGWPVALSQYRGDVLLIVNVASRCGFTKQYAGLQDLHEEYGGRGLVVLGFPANNFGNQEPGTDEEILTFCRTNYGVTFPVFSKISVKGEDKHPLYEYLTEEVENESLRGDIGWNFTKILVGRDGRAIARFEPKVAPESPELRAAIEQALGAG